MKTNTCARCGSNEVIPDLTVYAQAEQGGPAHFLDPDVCPPKVPEGEGY